MDLVQPSQPHSKCIAVLNQTGKFYCASAIPALGPIVWPSPSTILEGCSPPLPSNLTFACV